MVGFIERLSIESDCAVLSCKAPEHCIAEALLVSEARLCLVQVVIPPEADSTVETRLPRALEYFLEYGDGWRPVILERGTLQGSLRLAKVLSRHAIDGNVDLLLVLLPGLSGLRG